MTATRHGNFTLVELIVAMAVMTMVGLVIGASIFAFQRTYGKVQKAALRLERVQTIDRFADRYLRNSIPFYWPDTESSSTDSSDTSEVTERMLFRGEADELWFTARRRITRRNESALIFFRIYLNDENQLACDYRTLPLLHWLNIESQDYQTDILADNVESIEFKYANYDDNDDIEWLESWVEDDHTGIPPAILITVEWSDGTKTVWLRRSAGVSGSSTFEDGVSGEESSDETAQNSSS